MIEATEEVRPLSTAVIIGGGSAGAPAVRSLRKKLGPEHRVILVEKEEMLVNRAVLPLYAVGKKEERHLSRERSLLSRRGVELIPGKVLKIDPAARMVHTARHEIGYDLLLIAAGAELDGEHPPGMAAAGIDLQALKGAADLRASLPHFPGGEIAIVVASTGVRCPCGPYEYALLIENWFRRHERSRDISITIYTPEQAPLALFGGRISEAASGLLLNRNIRLHPLARVERIDPHEKMIFLNGESFPYDLLLSYAAAAPPPFVRESKLAGEGGWLKVDRHSMALQGAEDSIFAVGDVTEILTPSGAPLPRMGAVAHLQSLVAAANMARLMRGERPRSAYSGFAGQILETGKGALLSAGNLYREPISFLPLSTSRCWSPLKTLFTEKLWLRDHS